MFVTAKDFLDLLRPFKGGEVVHEERNDENGDWEVICTGILIGFRVYRKIQAGSPLQWEMTISVDSDEAVVIRTGPMSLVLSIGEYEDDLLVETHDYKVYSNYTFSIKSDTTD